MHWAPSGDVFLRNARGELVRYEFVDGDGLSPLRYAKVKSEPVCLEAVCSINIAGGKSRAGTAMLSRGPAPEAASVSLSADDETLDLGWPDVRLAGGVTVKSGRDGLVLQTAPECGNRPWRACD